MRAYCRRRGYGKHVVEGGINYLMRSWERTAANLAAGRRPPTFDEYLNDMDTRQILFEVIPLATDEEWENIQKTLDQADAIVLANTEPSERCIWGEGKAQRDGLKSDTHWWYFRTPVKLSGDWIEK